MNENGELIVMAHAKLRTVDDALADEMADGLDAELKQPPTTRTLISRSKKSLANSIDTLRMKAAEIESEMGAANAACEQAIIAAKSLRDVRVGDCRADLHQVTETIAALETARAKLAESVG